MLGVPLLYLVRERVGAAPGLLAVCDTGPQVWRAQRKWASTKQRTLGGSWVGISGVISPLIWVITIVTFLITPLMTPHEPPSYGPQAAMPFTLHAFDGSKT